MSPLSTAAFLPLTKGVVSTANPSLDMSGAVRSCKGFNLTGANRLSTRSGTNVALTFKDDAGTPADVTSVCGIWQFKDKAVAIAHSTVTSKAYLYVLAADLTGWYSNAGALTSNTTPQPAGVLWTSITTSPDVWAAEGLGTLYVAHSQGVDSTSLNFATRTWDGTFPLVVADYAADLDGTGSKSIYATVVIGYQNHLWFCGFGTGNAVANAYRPELARFSTPSFGAPSASDSLTIGNRVRSDREKIISAGIAGNALILQGTYITSRVTGYGRASWYREIVDESSGIAGPKAGVSDDAFWYYWGTQGPMRIGPQGPPIPMYEAIAGLVSSIINPEKIVASRDVPNNLVMFHVDTGTGIRVRCAYHTLRNVWITASDDAGLVIRAAGEVAPVLSSTAAGVAAPTGPPTTPSTTGIGATTATANWVAGDVAASTQIEYRVQGASSFTVVTTLGPGIVSYTFSGLTLGDAYEWRVAHVRAGQYSAYLGPSGGTQFTTTDQLQPPTHLALSETSVNLIYATWTNSGESGVSTEVYAQSHGTVGYVLKYTASPGESSANIGVSAGAGAYQVQIRHTKSAVTASTYEGPNTIVLT